MPRSSSRSPGSRSRGLPFPTRISSVFKEMRRHLRVPNLLIGPFSPRPPRDAKARPAAEAAAYSVATVGLHDPAANCCGGRARRRKGICKATGRVMRAISGRQNHPILDSWFFARHVFIILLNPSEPDRSRRVVPWQHGGLWLSLGAGSRRPMLPRRGRGDTGHECKAHPCRDHLGGRGDPDRRAGRPVERDGAVVPAPCAGRGPDGRGRRCGHRRRRHDDRALLRASAGARSPPSRSPSPASSSGGARSRRPPTATGRPTSPARPPASSTAIS